MRAADKQPLAVCQDMPSDVDTARAICMPLEKLAQRNAFGPRYPSIA